MWKLAIAGGFIMVAVLAIGTRWPALERAAMWQRFDNPGPLSKAHAFIGDNCAACHEAVAGVTAAKCVACHANDAELIQRQPTAFHASINACAPCHYEHHRGVQRPIHMDHEALARIGLAALRNGNETEKQRRASLLKWVHSAPGTAPNHAISARERLLNCVSCHRVQDVHKGNFGDNCAICHSTANWFIADYVHPSPSSRQCAQCHTPSPCHFMEGCLGMMGHMAGGEGARLEQCYRCHKTTSWYDFVRPMGGHH